MCFNQAEARNTNLFFPIPLKKKLQVTDTIKASFILEQINSVLTHVSQSLGLVLFQPSRSIRDSQKQWRSLAGRWPTEEQLQGISWA